MRRTALRSLRRLAAVACLAGSAWGCGGDAEDAPGVVGDREAAATQRPGRIIMIAMDTVRADHVSGYGAADATPALLAIAREGVRFGNFYAASSYTIPSQMAIFTGLDPAEHGVSRQYARLNPGVTTLAEALAAAGYRTRAHHEGGYVAARFGFGRGFEVYRKHPRVEVVRDVLPEILAWMREQGDAPYFLFLHSYAAHFPYGGFGRYRREHPERGLPSDAEIEELRRRHPGPPQSVEDAADIPAETREICTLFNQLAERHLDLLGCGDYVFDDTFASSPHYEADLAAVIRSYDERIRLVDTAIARIRATLEELSQWDDTLLVVTADHGEAFLEHGVARHDFVPFDEVLRVPLVISYPRRLGAGGGRVVEGLAWHLDLMPTLVALAGANDAGPGSVGAINLLPAMLGSEPLPPGRAVFPAVLRSAQRPQEPLRRVGIRGASKYIEGHRRFGDERGLLFDLAADPGEQRNLREQRPDAVAAFEALIREYEQGLDPRVPVHQNTGRPLEPGIEEAPPDLSDAERERLRELGYAY